MANKEMTFAELESLGKKVIEKFIKSRKDERLAIKVAEGWGKTYLLFNGQRHDAKDALQIDGDCSKRLIRAIASDIKALVRDSRGKVVIATEKEYYFPTRYWWDDDNNETLPSVLIKAKPCKEWNTLARLVKKYANQELSYTDYYQQSTFGKRGVYSPSGDKSFMAERSKTCEDAINWLRKYRNSKDTLKVEVSVYDDEEDKQHSIYYETECYGSTHHNMKLTLTTPSGKKKERLIWC